MFSVVCPGETNSIIPPQAQVRHELSFSAGAMACMTVVAPGAQGAGVFGTHGVGAPAEAVGG